jgi:energy-coupling factor transporter ATP-binding protein EcfA2
MAVKRNIIKVPKGVVEKICQARGCGKTTVYNALNYSSFSDEANLIRKEAIELYGGIKVTDIKWD